MWLCVGMPRSHLHRNAAAQRVNGTNQVPHHLSLPVPWLGAVLGGRRDGQGPAPAKYPPSRSALRSNQRRQGERAEWEVGSRLGQRGAWWLQGLLHKPQRAGEGTWSIPRLPHPQTTPAGTVPPRPHLGLGGEEGDVDLRQGFDNLGSTGFHQLVEEGVGAGCKGRRRRVALSIPPSTLRCILGIGTFHGPHFCLGGGLPRGAEIQPSVW